MSIAKHLLLLPLFLLTSCDSGESEAGEQESKAEQESFQTLEMLAQGEEQAKETQEMIDKRVDHAHNLLGTLNKNPTAKTIAGKPGFVISPWTGREIDVRGVSPGTIV
jgi:hypothetical protein